MSPNSSITPLTPLEPSFSIAPERNFWDSLSTGMEPLAERAIHRRTISPEQEMEIQELSNRVEEFEAQTKPKKMEAIAKKKSMFKHRFSDAPWFEWLKKKEVLLLGAGGIGSWVACCVARIGCYIHVYDMDIIEAHNLGGQLYATDHIGQNKAEATAKLADEMSGREANIECYGRFDEDSPIGPIVISAFDNMAGRQLAFEKWAVALSEDPENAKDYIFLDGRLLAEEYQVYAVTQGRLDQYRTTLFADGDVSETMCSLKATTHCSMGVASDIVSILSNFATNRSYGVDIRDVPFSISKSIPLFTYQLKAGDEQPKEIECPIGESLQTG